MKELPKYIRRIDDGALFVLVGSKYRLQESQMDKPHEYTYVELMAYHGKFEEVK
jgi:hypothetical protein